MQKFLRIFYAVCSILILSGCASNDKYRPRNGNTQRISQARTSVINNDSALRPTVPAPSQPDTLTLSHDKPHPAHKSFDAPPFSLYQIRSGEIHAKAERGDADAQNNLGYAYYTGFGVVQNCSEAMKWYRKAAEQADAAGQLNLGIMYKRGTCARRDFGKARQLILKSAEQGYAQAQTLYGLMHGNGDGGPVDLVTAYIWFSRAAAQGDSQAIQSLNICKGKMTPKQLAEAQRRVAGP